MNVSETDIALSFDTAEYYNLQEACDYLNRKHKVDNLTPKKLVKHIVKYDTSTYIHVWLKDEVFKIQAEYEPTILHDPRFKAFINIPCEKQDDAERQKWLKIYEKLERKTTQYIESCFYLGILLLRIDSDNLFNLSCSGNQLGVLLSGFNGVLQNDDLEADPTQLSFIEKGVGDYYAKQINHFDISIKDFNNVNLEDIKKYISLDFDSVYETSNIAYPNFKFHIDDLIIVHKDLITIEKQITQNDPIPKKDHASTNQQSLPRKRGVSPEKLLAQTLARHIADEEWKKDKDKEIKMSAMSSIVWSKLWELGFADTLPEQNRIREWIKGNAPDYASEGGRPPSSRKYT